MSFFKDDQGNNSMMRLIVFMVTCASILTVVVGLAGWIFGKLADAPLIVGAGALGQIGAEGFKALQKQAERG